MFIKSIYIKNFKAFEDDTIVLCKNSIIIGDNDAGKTSILQALDIFFHEEKIDNDFIRNPDKEVVIGILIENNNFIKKVFNGKTHKFDEKSSLNLSSLKGISYIYIPYDNLNPTKILNDLACSVVEHELIEDGTDEKITSKANEIINSILENIDKELLVVRNDNLTELSASSDIDIKKSIKYKIDSSGVPLIGRGSGYQKNLAYALLTRGNYNNVILGIDEIENSLSIKNVEILLSIIKQKFAQTLITTHSTAIMKVTITDDLVPLFRGNIKNITDLYSRLGGAEKKTFVLVEGKTDMSWIKKSIEIIGNLDKYIVVQCGGHGNIEPVYSELMKNGYDCRIIKDGDSGDSKHSLSKECIELYIPLDTYKNMFDSKAQDVPATKTDFFNKCRSTTAYANLNSTDNSTIKLDIAEKVNEFLKPDNSLIEEVKRLLN